MRPIDPRLLRYARATRGFLLASVVLGLAAAGLVIVQAVLIAEVVASAFTAGGGGLAGGGGADLRTPLLLLGATAVGRALVSWLTELAAHRASAAVTSELRRTLLHHATARLGPGWLTGQRTGELTTLATRGVDALDGYFARYLPQLALATVVPVAVLATVLTKDWAAAATIAATLPLIPLFMVLIGWATQAHTDRRWRQLARLSGHFLDVVAGLPTLKVFGRARAQAENIRAITADYRRSTLGTLRVAFLSSFALELLATLSVALVAVSVGLRLVHGDLDLATGLAVLVLAPEAYLPLRQVGTQFHAAQEGLSAAQEVFAVLEAEPAGPARGTRPLPEGPYTVTVDRLVVRHPGRSVDALPETSLTLLPGQTVALTGPSGAGKTTLLQALLGFVPPAAGRILVNGRELAGLDRDGWHRRIAWVPQHPHLVAGTVADNVRLARPGATDAAVAAALRQAAAGDLDPARHLGEGGAGLSAGQRQRVALARAFLADRPIVLLDEPTAALDGATEAAVVTAVRRLAAGRTVLLVTHRPALLAAADHVVHLGPGPRPGTAAAGHRCVGRSGGEPGQPHAPNGVGRSPSHRWEAPPGRALSRPDGDTDPVRGPGPEGRSPTRPAQVGAASGGGEALNRLPGGAGAPTGAPTGAPHSPDGALPGTALRVPDRAATPPRTAQGLASPETDHHTIESNCAGLRWVRALGAARGGRLAAATVLGALALAAAVGLMAVSGWLISRAAQQPPLLYLMVAVTATRAFGLGRAVFRYAERLLSHDAVLRVLADLRVAVYRRLARLAPAGLRPVRRGDLLSRVVADVDALQDYFLRWLLPVAVAATVSVAAVGFTAWLLPAAGAALAAGLLTAGVAVPALTGVVAARTERRLAPARGALAAHTVDLLTGTAETTVAGALPARHRTVRAADARLTAVAARSAAATALGSALTALATGLTVTAAAWLGTAAVAEGRLAPVWLATVVLVPLAAFEAVLGLPLAVQHRQRVRAAAERVREVLDAPLPVREPERPVAPPADPFPLVVRGLSARHPGQPRPALAGVDLTLTAGRRVAVVGPSGSGKTTLGHCLLRFLDPEAGTYTLGNDAVPATALDGDAVRRSVGLCAQDAHLFDSTLRENLRLARPEADDSALRSALAAARLLEWVDALPHGLDTLVGEHGAQLSGGQRQRLALARALLADFPVLVLDEPAEHLDVATADALTADLLRATEGRTTVLITHRLAGLAAVDEVLVLDGGRPVQRGTYAELAAADGPFRRMLDREATATALASFSSNLT